MGGRDVPNQESAMTTTPPDDTTADQTQEIVLGQRPSVEPPSAGQTQDIALGPGAARARTTSASAKIEAAGATDVGRRRERNEDQFLVAKLERRLGVRATSVAEVERRWLPAAVDGTLLVVADGMGGHDSGDVASSTAISALVDYLVGVMPWFDRKPSEQRLAGVRRALEAAIASGDERVTSAAASGGGKRMGTTLTVAYLHFPLMYVAHVGDSRAYLVRDGAAFQLTRDHTVGEQLRQEAKHHGVDDFGESSPLDHVLWNAIGAGGQAKPEIRRCTLVEGDTVVLCSDGLTGHVDDETIALIVSAAASPQRACEALIDAANADGGQDNITVVVARCGA